jgi:glycosyltransferase involved in cell wall biosynthesis
VSSPRVSFIIRTCNEAALIGRVLDVIGRPSFESEVIVVDSGSTDKTLDIAQAKGARVLHIRKEEFDYSKALNLGIQNARGEFIAVLSGHSVPCDSTWLNAMLAAFQDSSVAGVFSRQVAWPDTPWWETRRVRKEFGDRPIVYEKSNGLKSVPFSNAASCIRRTVWQQRPFTLPTGEDADWATWAVSQGYKIVYETAVAVYHSHKETCRQAMRRAIEFEKATDLKLGRPRTQWLTLRQAAGLAIRDLRDVVSLKHAPHSRVSLAWQAALRGYWFLHDFDSAVQFRSPVSNTER